MSYLEFFIIIIVAVIFIGPNEWPVVVKFLSYLFKKIKNIQQGVGRLLSQIISSVEDDNMKKVKGNDGKFYDAYPIDNNHKEEEHEHK